MKFTCRNCGKEYEWYESFAQVSMGKCVLAGFLTGLIFDLGFFLGLFLPKILASI